MIICQNGYENNLKLPVFARQFFDKDDDVYIFTNCHEENGKINAYTQIIYENKTYFYDFYMDKEKDGAFLKKQLESAMVLSFCAAASEIRKIDFPWGSLAGIRPAKIVRELLEKGYSKDETRGIIKRIYRPHDDKISLAMTVAENEMKILENTEKDSVSIYIGIPFCPTRCLYCSFVSTDIRSSGKYMDDFVRLLMIEIDKTAEIIKKAGKSVETIYIGGGTPTTLSDGDIKKLCDKINSSFDLSKLKEFTLEAGRPDTITPEKLAAAKDGGITRISINPQTMNEKTLKIIGRRHTPQMIREAFYAARAAGFEDINMDLIAGLPDESAEDFYRSLDEVLKLEPENITVHTMCLKKAADLRNSGLALTMAAEVNKMLSYTQREMARCGFEPYYMYRQKNILGNLENVGYARDGKMSIYNINIMEEIQTIIAMGGGGSSKIVSGDRIERVFNFKDPAEYIRRFDEILSKKEDILKLMTGDRK